MYIRGFIYVIIYNKQIAHVKYLVLVVQLIKIKIRNVLNFGQSSN